MLNAHSTSKYCKQCKKNTPHIEYLHERDWWGYSECIKCGLHTGIDDETEDSEEDNQ